MMGLSTAKAYYHLPKRHTLSELSLIEEIGEVISEKWEKN
jgi:hypothetical protein